MLFVSRLLMRFPFAAQEAHADQIKIAAAAPDVLAQPTLLDKAAGAIGANGALVIARNGQCYFSNVTQPEGIVQQQAQRLAAIAMPLILRVADADAQLAGMRGMIEPIEQAVADIFAVRFNGKLRAIAFSRSQAGFKLRGGAFQRERLPGVVGNPEV